MIMIAIVMPMTTLKKMKGLGVMRVKKTIKIAKMVNCHNDKIIFGQGKEWGRDQ